MGHDPTTIFGEMQLRLNMLVDWCTMNKLTLNIKKTKALIFFPPKKGVVIPSFKVHDQDLEFVSSYKYLGFVLDSQLKFDLMLQNLIRIVTHKLYLLAKMRSMLSLNAAIAVYKSKILTYIDYSSIFHFSTNKCRRDKLQMLQNHAIRIILKLPRRTNVDDQHVTLNLWLIENRTIYFVLVLMHHLINKHGQIYSDARNLQTRSHAGLLFLIPSRCSYTFLKSFAYKGMKKWNHLPLEMRLTNTIV